ncbi:MAG: hypothetical protein U5L10_04545 [Candidatus Moranbacteria bacterium]|nr:hypothetical protein [Candidatus Moranbacteria bacterium]
MSKNSKLPDFSKLFWFLDYQKLDAQRDSNLIVHQVLAYGSLEDIFKLIDFYGKDKVRQEFLNAKKGLYDPAVLKLIAFLLDCENIEKKKYVKKIYETTEEYRNPLKMSS